MGMNVERQPEIPRVSERKKRAIWRRFMERFLEKNVGDVASGEAMGMPPHVAENNSF